jgi:hypothetical protein
VFWKPLFALLGTIVLVALVVSSGGPGFFYALLLVSIVLVPAVAAGTMTIAFVQGLARRLGYSGPFVLAVGAVLGVFGAAPLAGGFAFYLATKMI